MNRKLLPEIPLKEIPRWEELNRLIRQLENAAPELLRVRSIGTSREGRELLLLTVTEFAEGAPEDRPALFVMGEIHATELNMSILHFTRKLLAEHRPGGILSRRVFYLIPRINPDGAELVLERSFGYIRSQTPEFEDRPNTLRPADVDGDGRILTMLVPSPTGTSVKDPLEPRLLIARTPESEGPFYHAMSEGLIHDWDGSDSFHSSWPLVDWNRNWPSGWQPKPEHGALPLAAPETRAVADFLAEHRNIFSAVSIHVGGEAILIPPGRKEAAVEPFDRKILWALGQAAKECCNVPVYANCEYNMPPFRWLWPFSDRPGTFQDFCYQHLGIPNADLEIGGGLYSACGVGSAELEKLQSWEEFHALNRRLLAWYDRQPDSPELCVPWRKFRHPQLGEVEIGGMIPLIFNLSPVSRRFDEAEALSRFYRKLAERGPELVWTEAVAEPLGGEFWRIRATVANCGELSTHLTRKAVMNQRFSASLLAFRCAENVELLSRERVLEFGELAGFSGKCSGEWVVRAPGDVSMLGVASVDCGAAGRKRITISKTGKTG